MLSKSQLESKLKNLKPVLADKYHVSKMGYFGSYANGQQTNTSDIDLLIEFSKPIGWNFFTLEKFLEENLGIKVDLVTPNALKTRLKQSILNQVHYV
jgi:predicted nucleotidyltransferase